jgi:hypothetical protein
MCVCIQRAFDSSNCFKTITVPPNVHRLVSALVVMLVSILLAGKKNLYLYYLYAFSSICVSQKFTDPKLDDNIGPVP